MDQDTEGNSGELPTRSVPTIQRRSTSRQMEVEQRGTPASEAVVERNSTAPPQEEPPLMSTKAMVASVLLALVITVNMQYGWYQDRKALDRPPLDKDYALEKMLMWMDAGGSHGILPPRSKVEVREDLGECKCIRGVAATHAIDAGETIAEIQFSQIIFDGPEEPLPSCTAEANWDVRLASALIREKAKGPASPFFYYIQALPDEILAAITLEDEDLEKVKYETGRSKLALQRPWMETLYLRCISEAPELIASASWHEFRWAIAVVQSRSFGVLGKRLEDSQAEDGAHLERRSDGSGLVPFMDLLNHHQTHNAQWETSPDGRSVFLKSNRAIAAGEEVYDSYGAKGNDELLISYGFVTRDNPNEYLALFDTVDSAVDWLFEKFPCRGEDLVSREPICWEEVMHLVRQRLLSEPLPPIIAKMKEDAAAAYYVSDIERMSLFANGEIDTRLVSAFETAFSQSCFLCARASLPAGEVSKSVSIDEAVEDAQKLVRKASANGGFSRLKTHTVDGRSELAIKLRVIELLEPFGISFKDGEESVSWRRAAKSNPPATHKERVLKEYNDSKLQLLLAKLDAVAS